MYRFNTPAVGVDAVCSHQAGLTRKAGATGAVTLIQRFGSALNLNIHCHILFLDGVYFCRNNRPLRFQRVRAPDKSELEDLVQLISQRVGRCLERQGLLEQDAPSAWLAFDPADDTDAMPHLLGSSVSYRIAVGPRQGQKAFMRRTIGPLERPDPGLERVAKANGLSLHAGVSCEGHERNKRERLCRYIARPAGEGRSPRPGVAKSWAQRLKRVFNIDIEVCDRCGGTVKVMACIEDQDTIDRILDHLRREGQEAPPRPLLVPPTRAPPGTRSLFVEK
jgi:hypothetical protein